MPIPVVINRYKDIQKVVEIILNARLNKQEQLCLNQDPDHCCINQVDSNQTTISIYILEKETNYLLERWVISVDEYHDNNVELTTFIPNLPLSKSSDVQLCMISDHCYSYLSNHQSTIEFKSDAQLKSQNIQLTNYISIQVIYDENISTSNPKKIDFMPWSKMQEKQEETHTTNHVHPLSRQRQQLSSLNNTQSKDIPAVVSPNLPFVAIRRLSRLSLSAMELGDTQPPAHSIPIPSPRMQYTHKALAFSTSPTNNRFLSPLSYEERRNSFTDSMNHHHHGCFVGSFEESLFSGRMSSMPSKPIMFHCQIGVLGYGECKPSLKCPPHWSILFPATFYKLPQQDQDYTPVTPYVGTVDVGDNELKKPTLPGYRIPPKGQLQVVVKNPNKTAVKLYLIPYDFTDMPKNTKTFLRQKSYTQGTKRLRYAIHLQICRTEKKRIYLYKTMKIVFFNQQMDAREKFDIVCEGPKEPVYIPL